MKTRRGSAPQSDQYLKTVEAFYADALDGGSWSNALSTMAALFRSAGATLEVFNKRPMQILDLHIADLPPEAETEYLAYYARHNPRAAYAFRNLSKETLVDYQLIDETAMDRDPYYAKYLKSLGLRYFVSGQITNTSRVQGVVSIQRSRRQGHMQGQEIDLMRRLLPHVRQAYDIACRLREAEGATRFLRETLDWLNDGVALLGPDGRVVYTNDAFRRIAERGDGVKVTRGFVDLGDPRTRTQFADALRTACCSAAGQLNASDRSDFLVARDGDAPAYVLSIRPIASAAEGFAATEPAAILFVHDPVEHSLRLLRAARAAFGLTEAEACLAEALLTGTSLGNYARKRALSMNTVYSHLRRLKEKTRCRRMADLIQKLNDVRPTVRPVS